MKWIDHYQLFLFDFDGLLVNTEEMHYNAYKRMMQRRGVDFTWDFNRYCQSAHYTSDRFRKEVFIDFPALKEQDPTWEILYKEKQEAIQEILKENPPNLMEGVEKLLNHLHDSGIKHCVVTHSPFELIFTVRKIHPVLDRIPFWITRNDYTHPKPDPECYRLAITKYSVPHDKIIGFEDTPRGLTALLGTEATPVLVTKVPYPEIPSFIQKGVRVVDSIESLNN